MSNYRQSAVRHLHACLRPARAAVRAAAEAQAERRGDLGYRADVTDAVAALLLDELDGEAGEVEVRFADGVEAAAKEVGCTTDPPLVRLKRLYQLDSAELGLLVLCAAPHAAPAYGRLYAYLHDDRTRRHATVELLGKVAGLTPARTTELTTPLGRFGRLRRSRLVVPVGDADADARQALDLGPEVFAYLTGARVPDTTWYEPGILLAAARPAAGSPLAALAEPLAARPPRAVGVFGAGAERRERAAAAVAAAAGAAGRRFDPADPRESVMTAAAAGQVLVIDAAAVSDRPGAAAALTDVLVRSPVRLVFHADAPVRPRWAGPNPIEYELPPPPADADPVCAPPGSLLTIVRPRRTATDLILPEPLRSQLLELPEFIRRSPAVADEWGLGRKLTGGAGLKVLFCGEPGTGKTLAAEVLAHDLKVPLVKLNAGRILSKWVGESQRHVDAALDHARGCGGLLFVDECDALLGRRGEIRHGVDRYAGAEVSHLMTRLEEYEGACVLATNLRENLDPGAVRRVHGVFTFPRPEWAERRKLWEWAVGDRKVKELDLAAFAGLEMTGAGIVTATRTAFLLAVTAGKDAVEPADVVEAVARQYRREGRLLPAEQLGPYRHLV